MPTDDELFEQAGLALLPDADAPDLPNIPLEPGGDVGTDLVRLEEEEQDITPTLHPFVKESQRLIAGMASAPPGVQFKQLSDALRAAGFPEVDTVLDSPFREAILADAAVNTHRFLKSEGFADLQGRGLSAARETIDAAILAGTLIKALPLFGRERLNLQNSALNSALESRSNQMRDELTGGLSTPEAIRATSKIAGLIAQLQQQPEDKVDALFKAALFFSRRPPRNEQEANIIRGEGGDVPGARMVGNIDTALTDTTMGLLSHQERVAGLRQVFGPQWATILLAEYDNLRDGYVWGRLGRTPNNSPGTTKDGLNFTALVPEGAMAALISARTAALAPGLAQHLPAQVARDLAKVEAFEGKEAADALRMGLFTSIGKAATEQAANRLFKADIPEADLTPAARSAQSVLGRAATVASEAMMNILWEGPIHLGQELEAAAARNWPEVEEFAKAGTFLLTRNEALAEATKRPSQALAFFFRGAMERGNLDGLENLMSAPLFQPYYQQDPGLQAFTTRLGVDPTRSLLLQDATPEQQAALLTELNRPMDVFAQDTAGFDKTIQRSLSRAHELGGKGDFGLEFWQEFGLGTVAVMGKGVKEPFFTFVDDPSTGPGMMASAWISGKATGAAMTPARQAFGVAMRGTRLHFMLKQLAVFNPEQATRIRTAANRALAGKDLKALDAASVAAQIAAKDFSAGIPIRRPGEWARHMRRVWDDIETGPEKAAIDTMLDKTLPIGTINDLKATFSRLTGWVPRVPNKAQRLLLDHGAMTDAEMALRDVVGGGGDVDVTRRRIEEFQQKTGRPPSREELFEVVMPEQRATLDALMLAAERHNFRDPVVLGTLSRGLGNILGTARRLDRLPEFIESVADQITRISDTANDTIAARLRLGLVRPRRELAFEIAMQRVTNRVSENQMVIDTVKRITDRQWDELPGLEAAVRDDQLKLQRLQTARTRMRKHNPNESLAAPDDADLWSEISDPDIELLLDEYPTLFDGLDKHAVYNYTQTPARPEALAASQARIQKAKAEVRKAVQNRQSVRDRPAVHDDQLRAWEKDRAELVRRRDALAANNEPRDPHVDYELERHTSWIEERQKNLVERQIDPDQKITTERAFRRTRHEHQMALEAHRRIRDGNVVREITPEGRELFMQSMVHRGVDDHARLSRAIAELETVASQRQLGLAGGEVVGISANPFVTARLPPFLQGQSIVDFLRKSLVAKESQGLLVEDLAIAVRKMPAGDRAILGRAQRNGTLPSELAKKYPAVARYYEMKTGRSKWTDPDLGQLDRFFETDAEAYTQILEHARATGRIPDELFQTGGQRFYDPVVRGMHERPRTIVDPKGREAIQAAAARTGADSQTLRDTRAELMFKRDTHEWRLRIDEPEATVNRFFQDEAEGRQWLRDNYGDEALDGLKKEGAFFRGTTPYGDSYTLAEPIGKKGERFNPRTFGATAQQRLNKLKTLIENTMNHSIINGLNQYGGRVLTDTEHRAMILKYGEANNLARQFDRVPDNKDGFGHLAGKWVHKSILREIQRATRGFHEIDSLLLGIREGFTAYGTGVPAQLAEFGIPGLNRFFDDVAEIVRTTRITRSVRAFVNGMLFNKISDFAADTRIYAVENIATSRWAFRMIAHPAERLGNPLWQAARRHNIATGFFPGRDPSLNLLMAEALSLDRKSYPKLQTLHTQRKALLQEMHDAKLAGKSTPDLTNLEREFAALNAAVEEAELGMSRKIGREVLGSVVRRLGKDVFGKEARVGFAFRRAYNFIDEHAKLAGFANLINRGVPEQVAARVIKTFFQNYPDVPYALRAVPTWARSLVVSFPYEAVRIGLNMINRVPSRALSLFSVIPALNTLNMARAGISWDRMAELLDARGHKDGVNAALAFTKTLYLTDPQTGSITDEIDFGGALPFADVLAGHGVGAQVINDMVPPGRRSLAKAMIGLGLSFASNFFFNHPVFSLGGLAMRGRDSVTGELIMDENTPLLTRAAEVGKAIAWNIIPPIVGQDLYNLVDAMSGEVRPLTGRPHRHQQPFTAFLRMFTGVGMKGVMADRIGNWLGLGRGNVMPALAGDQELILNMIHRVGETPFEDRWPRKEIAKTDPQNVLRSLYYTAVDQSLTKEQRVKAWAGFTEELSKKIEFEMGPIRGELDRTQRQKMLELYALQDEGIIPRFAAQSVRAQAMVLITMDMANVSDNWFRDLIEAAQFTPLRDLQLESDPDMVRDAIRFLKEHTAKTGTNPRLKDWLNHLQSWTLPQAEIKGMLLPFERQRQVTLEQAFGVTR